MIAPLSKTRSRSNREQKRFPKFLWKIRGCPCLICGGQAEAAHVRYSSAKHNKLNGKDDHFTIPLCPGHHRLYPDAQHNSGEEIWWQERGIDPIEVAIQLWGARDDQEKMIEICANVMLTQSSDDRRYKPV